MNEDAKRSKRYYFGTRDLLLIAIVGCLGGVLSTYVGYLGTTIGNLTGIPFSGQLLSGLHVFWIVLILALVDRKGSGVLAGLLKGFVEFVSGSHLGLFVIVISAVEGLFAEIGFWPLRKYRTLSYLLAGGLASWANVLVQQALWAKYGALPLVGLFSLFAIASGIIFGGCLALGIAGTLYDAAMIRRPREGKPAKINVPLLIVVILLSVVAVALSFQLMQPAAATEEPGTAGGSIVIEVSGSVDRPQEYSLAAFRDRYVTVNAEKNDKTAGTRDYTGVPLRLVLEEAGAWVNASDIDIIGSDGYQKTLPLEDVTGSNGLILADEGGNCLLVLPGYPLNAWVRHVAVVRVHS